MKTNYIHILFVLAALISASALQAADFDGINYSGSVIANSGSGDFAPYYMASNVHGIVTQPYSTLLRASIEKPTDTCSRVSYGFGADFIGGYTSKTSYSFYNASTASFASHKLHPADGWIQQLYVEGKYRSVFVILGMKEQSSKLLNFQLSSGDISMSGNARPVPGLRTGFIDFQDIPYTNHWVQICGEISYGKTTDKKWLEDHYNYYNDFITTGSWFDYKNIYFRTNPEKPFSVTAGMQASCQFGGYNRSYEKGVMKNSTHIDANLKAFFRCLVPGSGGNSGGDYYVEGNHVGSIDFLFRYRLHDGTNLKAYYQTPWEDGSGMGKLNGFDGLYGIEYAAPHHGAVINGAVIEYLDFTNQSGPIHWSPFDNPGTTITRHATGDDNYYNNYCYNGYQYYGMSYGSPFITSPLYNLDGYMSYTCNRMRGFHVGVSGSMAKYIDYRVLASYRKSWGTPFIPFLQTKHDFSALFEATLLPETIEKGLSMKVQLALDRGTLYGNNASILFSISYSGLLKF
ncbi:MAG: capsule assembly Wzi family protein [Muribaculaceae bacterium]|nr:capsule assembly Wzi family protein [Muribaculaceae bacterium]